jgi:hypothetical protein
VSEQIEVEFGEQADELDSAKEQQEPLDLTSEERKLVTQPYDLGVRNLSDDIRRGRLRLNVEYQRKYVWDSGKASRLIESLLLNVPIPVCYFAEDEDGSYEVIDGLQRLTTIDRYLKGDFGLSGISVLDELSGKRFDQLALKDQRRLENRTIRCIVVTAESHPDIKFDVFERLNTGAASLSAQELRNCIYRGDFNDGLKRLAKADEFTSILGSKSNQRMENEELVLRFLALSARIEDYKPPLRQLLNNYMRQHRKMSPSDEEVAALKDVCDSVRTVWGDSAFTVPGADGRVHRAVNKALFDSIMLSLRFADQDAVKANVDGLQRARMELLEDPDFSAAIGRATADRTRMFHRVNAMTDKLRELGIATKLPHLSS